MKQIGTLDDFPEGEGTKVDVDGIDIAVFNVDGELYGVHNLCPHRRLPLDAIGRPKHPYTNSDEDESETIGEINETEECIRCPWHGMEFDLETGSNPATKKQVATFDIQVDGSDVFVEM